MLLAPSLMPTRAEFESFDAAEVIAEVEVTLVRMFRKGRE